MLLHLRFGHLGAPHLIHLSIYSGVVTGLQPSRQQLLMADPLCSCAPCRLAKASRPGPHPARDPATSGHDSTVLRLSSDLIGPVEPRGYDGTRYLIGFTILNYSISKAFSLKSKDQALEKFV
eukprot:1137064-Prorocentrum_minimum.AAC.1